MSFLRVSHGTAAVLDLEELSSAVQDNNVKKVKEIIKEYEQQVVRIYLHR